MTPPASERRRFLVAYDVTDDRRRARVEKACKGFGRRIQYSIFECYLDPLRRDKLEERLLNLLDLRTDRLGIYAVQERGSHRYGPEIEDPPVQHGTTRIV